MNGFTCLFWLCNDIRLYRHYRNGILAYYRFFFITEYHASVDLAYKDILPEHIKGIIIKQFLRVRKLCHKRDRGLFFDCAQEFTGIFSHTQNMCIKGVIRFLAVVQLILFKVQENM